MIGDTAQPAPPVQETVITRPTRLWNKNYLLLWQGQFVSRVGNQFFEIALTLWVIQLTGSAALMGLLLMTASIPALVLAPIGGVFADRYSRRRTIILSDLLSGLVVLSLAALAYAMPGATPLLIGWLFVTAISLSVISSFFGPAIAAAIPDLVPNDRLSNAYSLGQLSMQVSVFIGQGIGATLFRILGAPTLFLFNGLSFLFSAGSETFIRIPQRTPERVATWRERFGTFRADLISGFRYIWSKPGLKSLVLITALGNFFTAPILLLFPFYVRDYLKAPIDWYGWLLAAFGVGSLIGYLLVSLMVLSGSRRMVTLLAVMMIDTVAYAALLLAPNPPVALVIALFGGMTSAFVMVHITALIQLSTPTEFRGRVGSLLTTLTGSVTPIAFGLSGIVADLTKRNIPLIYLTCAAIILGLQLSAAANRHIRAFLGMPVSHDDDQR